MTSTRPARLLTPKEFAAAVLDGRRSERWVQERCREFIRTRGRRGIPVAYPSRPYLIHPKAAHQFAA